MSRFCLIPLFAAAALAGGCMTIGSDGPAGQGRLVPVGADAADFSRARAILLQEDVDRIEAAQAELRFRKQAQASDAQAYYNKSATVWNEARLLPYERPRYAVGYCGLALEHEMRVERYTRVIGAYESRIGYLAGESNGARSDAEEYDAMRLVAP